MIQRPDDVQFAWEKFRDKIRRSSISIDDLHGELFTVTLTNASSRHDRKDDRRIELSSSLLLHFGVRTGSDQFLVDTKSQLEERLLSIGTGRVILRTVGGVKFRFRVLLLTLSGGFRGFQSFGIVFDIG